MRGEPEAKKHVEKKVVRMLSYDKDVEKSEQLLNRTLRTACMILTEILGVSKDELFMDSMYWSQKAGYNMGASHV